MKEWGFCGPTFPGYSKAVAVERCINLFPVKGKKTKAALINVPGKRRFGTLTDRPGRGIFSINNRLWAVAGKTLFEVGANGVGTAKGSVIDSGSPASMASNGNRGNQLMTVSGGFGTILNTSTGDYQTIGSGSFPLNATTCAYLDGYFIAASGDRFALSDLENGLVWGADVGQRAGAPEDMTGAIVDHEILWLFGSKGTEPWFDSGAASFPFEPVPSGFLENGAASGFGATKLGDSIMWVVEDERGGRWIARNQGYTAIRVSTDGVDALLNNLTNMRTVRAWSYDILGHNFAVFTWTDQDLTLQYDVVEDAWSELGFWNTNAGRWEADRSMFHASCFGKHLTLDRETGDIWELSMDVYADGDNLRRWLRRAPHISNENKTIFYHRAELDAQIGVGGVTSAPAADVILRYSDDGGETWSNELARSLGAQGKYLQRVAWDALGSSRNRVFELSGTAPVKTAINDLYLMATPGLH